LKKNITNRKALPEKNFKKNINTRKAV